eukprot:scaffold243267_cov31-Tisochrysis_lutea.AAC.1
MVKFGLAVPGGCAWGVQRKWWIDVCACLVVLVMSGRVGHGAVSGECAGWCCWVVSHCMESVQAGAGGLVYHVWFMGMGAYFLSGDDREAKCRRGSGCKGGDA